MKKQTNIDVSIQNIQNRLNDLESAHRQNSEEYSDLLDLLERLERIKAINPKPEFNPNVLLEVGGKVLIAGAVLAIERSGVLTTKIPLAGMINFKK